MICLIQRVRSSQLHIEGALHAEIGQGLLALVGIEKEDTEVTLARMLDKLYKKSTHYDFALKQKYVEYVRRDFRVNILQIADKNR